MNKKPKRATTTPPSPAKQQPRTPLPPPKKQGSHAGDGKWVREEWEPSLITARQPRLPSLQQMRAIRPHVVWPRLVEVAGSLEVGGFRKATASDNDDASSFLPCHFGQLIDCLLNTHTLSHLYTHSCRASPRGAPSPAAPATCTRTPPSSTRGGSPPATPSSSSASRASRLTAGVRISHIYAGG